MYKVVKVENIRDYDTKIKDINPIWANSVTILNESDLNRVVELPLLEACKILFKKNIRTLMSSCNRYNVNGLDNYLDNPIIGKKMSEIYEIGNGFAWIMFDYDALNLENQEIFRELHQNNPESVIYTLDNEELLFNADIKFKKNYKETEIECYGRRVVILRLKLDKNTTSKEVEDYFIAFSHKLIPQKENLITQNEVRYRLFMLTKKYEQQLKQMEIEISENQFLNPMLYEDNSFVNEHYGIDNDYETICTLFVIATLDNFNLLEDECYLMILSFNKDKIHILYNGKEYYISDKSINQEGTILYSKESNIKQYQKELELINLFSQFDYHRYLKKMKNFLEKKVNKTK